jgi:hypothetical protein
VYNVDDMSYAFINQQYVIGQSYLTDSGFIDVTDYIQNGLNNFTFITYNYGSTYNWGFQIMQNDEIVFDDTAGLAGLIGANNADYYEQNEIVYNNTVSIDVTKCTTISITPSTGEFSDSILCDMCDLFA